MAEKYRILNRFDCFQQKEIQRGFSQNLDISVYAHPALSYSTMRQLRKGLEDGNDLTSYIDRGTSVLCELRKAMASGISLTPYVDEGYDGEQLLAIRHALEKGIPIQPYLNIAYHGACITEIATGLEHNINVSSYADTRYTWRKMREIRLGLEQHLDISQYANPLYSYWQMQEIRLGLLDGLDVSRYKSLMYTAKEMRKRRLSLKKTKTVSHPSGQWTILKHDDYDIRISPDGMIAYLDWHSKSAISSVEDLEKILYENGIVYGINYNELVHFAAQHSSDEKEVFEEQTILIAKGTPAVHGHNGRYEWFFDTKVNRLPKPIANGDVDFKSLKWFEPVKENQVLAVYHHATTATDGITVTGTPILAKNGKEKPPLKGSGFHLLPDLKTYVASKDGHIRLNQYEMIIADLMVLDHIPASSETLQFDCDVYVKGNITGPVTMNINGSLAVDGCASAAQITCNGNVLLKSGINSVSGNRMIEVEGCIVSKFFEYVTLKAKGNIYFGTSLNSNLSSDGEIVSYGKKGGIIGGTSYSEKGYCLPNLGNSAGQLTTLLLGSNEEISSFQQNLIDKIIQIKSALSELEGDKRSVKLQELKTALKEKNALEKRISKACRSKVIVENRLYENVQICYMGKNLTTIPSTQVKIHVVNEHLIIEKFYDRASNAS